MTIKVFLLDDHEVVRLGLRQLLESEPDIEVIGEAGRRPRRSPAYRRCGPTWQCSTCGCRTVTGSRCAGRSGRRWRTRRRA